VTYKDNIKEIDSLELTINNWDAATRRFVRRRRRITGRSLRFDQGQRPLSAVRTCNKQVELWMATRATCG
jgi:hypothetical protein